MGETRTLAVQIPAELFQRLNEYCKSHKLKKKEFILGLVRKALEESESAE